MTQLTSGEIENIRKRAEKATGGEWSYTALGGKERSSTIASFGTEFIVVGEIRTLTDAEFIANARTDILKLLAEIERVKEADDGLR